MSRLIEILLVELVVKEPDLLVDEDGEAAFVLGYCQLDAPRASAFLSDCYRSVWPEKSEFLLDVPVKPRKVLIYDVL
ncbi:hypothetical protein FEM48_Zijuj09G0210400 [Ziziphus jujuba var. spinosa]|uniref:Uncharacterized protein n=1 Tax=Ziziphus jujuba var. spinosa TaxID=714518 RepID=A0A978UVA9_ZIZJJ|nr:hypothetical protein FEM48_Zijuj09G0210400 [Ziziphus jujuba var. spinosa]